MKYNYTEAIKNDIREYIKYDVDLSKYEDRASIEEYLNDELWTVDGVTGNASGSYTFNTWKAEENLCHNLCLLKEAIDEFGGDYGIILENPESADVTIRCYLLGGCISAVLDEMEEAGDIKRSFTPSGSRAKPLKMACLKAGTNTTTTHSTPT